MLIHKAFKYWLDTNVETEKLMSQYAGNCRFLWNKALGLNVRSLENKQPLLWYRELEWMSKFCEAGTGRLSDKPEPTFV